MTDQKKFGPKPAEKINPRRRNGFALSAMPARKNRASDFPEARSDDSSPRRKAA
jgi:hypothetical protein